MMEFEVNLRILGSVLIKMAHPHVGVRNRLHVFQSLIISTLSKTCSHFNDFPSFSKHYLNTGNIVLI